MSKIPELLTSLSGEKIDTAEKWEKFRRGEVKSLLSEYIYGFRDIEKPENLYFKLKEETVIDLTADALCLLAVQSCPRKNKKIRGLTLMLSGV